jgi:hypothetical protein
MRPIGFSTGALALGDFDRALEILRAHPVPAVELSALRDKELHHLMARLPDLDLSAFTYVSVHAPSKFVALSEASVADMLAPCIDRQLPIVIHPDAMSDLACWKQFGELLCIENMDKRKRTGRTADELDFFFTSLPEARFCLDLAHARQVDDTMSEARYLLRRYGSRLMQLHVSELDAEGHHFSMSMASIYGMQRVAHYIDPKVPVIIESQVVAQLVEHEVEAAELALTGRVSNYVNGNSFAAIDLIR